MSLRTRTANISGNLSIGNISSANNLTVTGNVGIGTNNPSAKLQVGDGSATTEIRIDADGGSGNGGFIRGYKDTSNASWYLGDLNPIAGGTNSGMCAYVYGATPFAVFTNGLERLRVDSAGNLGIGTASPSAKLDVLGVSNGLQARFTGQASRGLEIKTFLAVGTNNAGVAYDAVVAGAGTHVWQSGGTELMRLDDDGNLGLGVTPSAWTSTFKVFQIGAAGSVYSQTNANSVYTASNIYFDGTNSKYINTDFATTYRQFQGTHAWFTAPSGTAGNTITFTQAMTLDASGNLGVGTTSPKGRLHTDVPTANTPALIVTRDQFTGSYNGGRIRLGTYSSESFGAEIFAIQSGFADNMGLGFSVEKPSVGRIEAARITSGGEFLVGTTSASMSGATRTVAISSSSFAAAITTTSATATNEVLCLQQSATSGDNSFIVFKTEGGSGTARGNIDYNRAGGLVRYNTTSDYRAKDIIGPLQNVGETIDGLKVYEGLMKGATESRPMLVAHEAQEYAPYAVSGVKDEVNEDGTPKFQQMDVSALVPLLLAEIQSLRARVAALESK